MNKKFQVFPPETIQFFRDLEANNNRDWFMEHKRDFIDYVQTPAVAFIGSMGTRLQVIAPNIIADLRTNGAGSLMRIYRDVRFSKDKTPYKTNLGIIFWEGAGKKTENPGFYFHLASNELSLYCGVHMFTKEVMTKYRTFVDNEHHAEELSEIMAAIQAEGCQVGGDQYKRVPTGFKVDHPSAELLKYKGLHASIRDLAPDLITKPDFMDYTFEKWRIMAPLHQWLVKLAAEDNI
jgi:uncharacterized protein (TIGR02453 family)